MITSSSTLGAHVMSSLPLTSMNSFLSQSSKPHFIIQFSSVSHNIKSFNPLYHKNCLTIPRNRISTSFKVSCSTNPMATTTCNGWDDPTFKADSDQSSESNQLRKFLYSMGINDTKYALMYVIGFVSALAISRIKISSIIVFPATAIIFALGFSFGFINGKPQNGARNKKLMDDGFRVYSIDLKIILGFFDEFDAKVRGLKSDLKGAIDYKRVGITDLEGYVDAIESMGESVMNAKKDVENCADNVLAEESDVEKNSKLKFSKRKEANSNGFGIFAILHSFFLGNSAVMKPNKVKDLAKREPVPVKDVAVGEVPSGFTIEERAPCSKSTRNATLCDLGDAASFESPDRNGNAKLRAKEISRVLEYKSTTDMDNDRRRFINDQDFHYNSSIHTFASNKRVDLNMSELDEVGSVASHDSLRSRVRMSHMESSASMRHEQIYHDSNEAYQSSFERQMAEDETYTKGFSEDHLHTRDYQSKQEEELTSSPSSSSMVSEDVLFDKYLTRASVLLRQAKDSLRVRNDETQAEKMLNESAILLNKAIDMKPVSLLAVGQLGNTYLLHGEMKFRITRELRALLSRSSNLSARTQTKVLSLLDEPYPSRDRIASLLISLCEECEELLIEAGRKYRMALSIDGTDARALYNWGLALTFRAQLIADIGPAAARDADKLFMAAIDKFDAMMVKSNVYAPDALFRWGVALQQRSRLRPNKSRDKVKLLQQAKRLYEDALDKGSDNVRVKEALSTCISELDLRLI